MAVTPFPSSGATPRRPLLLTPVKLPFRGDYEHVTVLYNASAVQDLVADNGALQEAMWADLKAEQDSLLARADTEPEGIAARLVDLTVEYALRRIQACVHSVEWAGPQDPADPVIVPDPADPLSFGAWDETVIAWVGGPGIAEAEAASSPFSVLGIRNVS